SQVAVEDCRRRATSVETARRAPPSLPFESGAIRLDFTLSFTKRRLAPERDNRCRDEYGGDSHCEAHVAAWKGELTEMGGIEETFVPDPSPNYLAASRPLIPRTISAKNATTAARMIQRESATA